MTTRPIGQPAHFRAARDPVGEEGVMFRKSLSHTLLVLVLSLSLSSAASAAPVSWSAAVDLLRDAFGLGSSALAKASQPRHHVPAATPRGRATSDRSCGIDPNGNTGGTSQGVALKYSAGIDPDGQRVCTPQEVTPKRSCGIDPDGHMVCTP